MKNTEKLAQIWVRNELLIVKSRKNGQKDHSMKLRERALKMYLNPFIMTFITKRIDALTDEFQAKNQC